MNPFLIKVQACSVQRQNNKWVSASELSRAKSVSTLEQNARQRIAKAIKKARKQRDAAHNRAKEILALAQEQASDSSIQWQKEAKDEAVAEAIKWHLDETQLTKAVLEELQSSIADKINTVLTAWTLEQNPSPFLIKRLTAQVSDRVGQETVILKVAAEDFQEMELAFEGSVKVEISPTLSSGQAELSSISLTARIDLAEHLHLLLNTFVGERLSTKACEVNVL